MMSGGNTLPLPLTQHLAAKLVTALEPACEQIVVAGSVRRQKAQIGDIELVCIPRIESHTAEQINLFGEVVGQKTTVIHYLDHRLNALLTLSPDHHPIFRSMEAMAAVFKCYRRPAPVWAGPDLKRWGERYKRFYLWVNDKQGAVAVDVFITTPAAWGAILTIRTGPHDFSKALMNHIRYKTPYVQEEGHLRVKGTKEIVPVPSETDYFKHIGVPFLEPEKRTLQRLRIVTTMQQQKAGVRV
ncbi:MAG: hypothetical protein HY866_04110 [Chloroflexi bacterium]|nr:hypothetical protein [Chloroflexota bacterium]